MADPILGYQPFDTSGTSLAKGYKANYDFGSGGRSDSGYYYPESVSSGTSPGSAVEGSLASGDLPFFNGGSLIGNIGQGLNLVGSGVSLVGMLQGMRDARKNHRLNRRNLTQQMDQSKIAFDRAVERQDGTAEAIRERNERVAQMNQ